MGVSTPAAPAPDVQGTAVVGDGLVPSCFLGSRPVYAGDDKGRPYEFITGFKGLRISMEVPPREPGRGRPKNNRSLFPGLGE